jgi:hypothetical protein
MAQTKFEIGIIIGRRKLNSPWSKEKWLPVAALPAAPDLPLGARLALNGDEEMVFAGARILTLHGSETGHYRDNILSGSPSLWIALNIEGDQPKIASVTADPYEGEAMAEGIGQIIEAVPMPRLITEAIAAFVAEHHVERPFIKRKRDRSGSRE